MLFQAVMKYLPISKFLKNSSKKLIKGSMAKIFAYHDMSTNENCVPKYCKFSNVLNRRFNVISTNNPYLKGIIIIAETAAVYVMKRCRQAVTKTTVLGRKEKGSRFELRS